MGTGDFCPYIGLIRALQENSHPGREYFTEETSNLVNILNQFYLDPVSFPGWREETIDAVSIFPEEIDIMMADNQNLELEFLGNGVNNMHQARYQVRAKPAILLVQD